MAIANHIETNGAAGVLNAAADECHMAMQNLIALVDFVQLAAYSKEVISVINLASMADLMRRELSTIRRDVDILRIAAVGE